MMPSHIITGLLAAVVGMAAPAALGAPPVRPGEDVQAAVDATEPGGTVELLPGIHRGPVRLERNVALVGRDGAVLDAAGQGSVVFVTAEGAAVRNLVLRGSGSDHVAMDSGVYLERTARRALVEGNRIELVHWL